MNPLKFKEYQNLNNDEFINVIENERIKALNKFDMPESFWFKVIDNRCQIHFAVIKKENEKYCIYFINVAGRVFDKLEYKTKNIAKRLLRKNKFLSSNNVKAPYKPLSPCYIKLAFGKKTAPYSKGNLWLTRQQYRDNVTEKSENKYSKKTVESKKSLTSGKKTIRIVLFATFVIITSVFSVVYFFLKCFPVYDFDSEALKKAEYVINSAIKQEYEKTGKKAYEFINKEDFASVLRNNVNLMPKDSNYYEYGLLTDASFITADGIIYTITKYNPPCEISNADYKKSSCTAEVDINGIKRPNKINVDRFVLVYDKNSDSFVYTGSLKNGK